jgi:hypothetical protein
LAGQVGYIGTGVDGAIEQYAPGLVLTTYSTIIQYNGEFYRPSASATLPYTTTATLPDADSNLVSVGDAVLRQELAGSLASGQGANLVNGATIYAGSVAELENFPAPIAGQEATVRGVTFRYSGTSWLPAKYVTPEAYGAVGDGVANDSVPLQSAYDTGAPVLITGRYFAPDVNINTESLIGPGTLVNSNGFEMPEYYRKKVLSYDTIMTLEDEYGVHEDGAGAYNLNYTSFFSSATANGVEYIVGRCAFEHNPDLTKESKVVLYEVFPGRRPSVLKSVIYTSTVGEDVRDPNISIHKKNPNLLIIKFALNIGVNQWKAMIITYDARISSVVNTFELSGMSLDDFTFGNSIITPSGFLLISTYRSDGNSIKVWRSSAALTSSTTALTMNLVATLGESSDCFEPTIGVWKEKLVLVYRKNTATTKVTYTYDLEGGSGWYPTYNISEARRIYSPACLAYSENDAFTVIGVLGTNRISLVSASTTDLKKWYTIAKLRVAGWPANVSGTNGYPSISDMGGEYAITSFYDVLGNPVAPTRVERMLIPKSLLDVGFGNDYFVPIVKAEDQRVAGSSGIFYGGLSLTNAKYASDGRNYSTEVEFKDVLSIDSAYLLVSGTSSDASLEVYEDGALVGTSSAVSVSSSTASAIEFPFAGLTVSLGKTYKFKLISSTALAVYDYRHGNKAETKVDFKDFVVTGSFDSSGSSIAAFGLILPVFKKGI